MTTGGEDILWGEYEEADRYIKNLTIYKKQTNGSNNVWPPEYNDTNTEYNDKTYCWANRLYPYRGTNTYNEFKTSWTTPCYLVGYSPVWVSCGLNNDEDYWKGECSGNFDGSCNYPNSSTDKPIWEAANPYFSNVSGLYTATDADMNAYIAYNAAAKKWKNKPPLFDNTGKLSGGTNDIPYDCDVADYDDDGEDANDGGTDVDYDDDVGDVEDDV